MGQLSITSRSRTNTMKFTIFCLLIVVASTSAYRNSGRQLVGPNGPQPFRTLHDDSDHTVDIMDNRIEDIELDEDKDDGILDAILGEGAQSRIVTQVSDWLVDKATSNPGCVERFVCETYRTGASLNGIPYGVMQLTNAFRQKHAKEGRVHHMSPVHPQRMLDNTRREL